MDENKYSTSKSILTMLNESFHKSIPQTFQCPDVAVCSARGVQCRGNHWGYVNNASGGEIHFVSCPAFHCCKSIKDCQSFDTCRNERTGNLCGKCHDGFSMSLFNEYGCVVTEQCESKIVWFLILLSGAFILLIFTYPEKIFKVFDFLESERKRVNKPQATQIPMT